MQLHPGVLEPPPQVEVFAHHAARQVTVEETVRQEEIALHRQVPGPERLPADVVRIAGAHAVPVEILVARGAKILGQRPVVLAAPPIHEAEARVAESGPVAVKREMLRDQLRRGDHVVVEEQHDPRRGMEDASVTSGGGAAPFLPQRSQAERCALRELRDELRRAVAGAVVDDHDLVVFGRCGLECERAEKAAQRVAAAHGRHDDGQRGVHGALRCRRRSDADARLRRRGRGRAAGERDRDRRKALIRRAHDRAQRPRGELGMRGGGESDRRRSRPGRHVAAEELLDDRRRLRSLRQPQHVRRRRTANLRRPVRVLLLRAARDLRDVRNGARIADAVERDFQLEMRDAPVPVARGGSRRLRAERPADLPAEGRELVVAAHFDARPGHRIGADRPRHVAAREAERVAAALHQCPHGRVVVAVRIAHGPLRLPELPFQRALGTQPFAQNAGRVEPREARVGRAVRREAHAVAREPPDLAP